MRSIWALLLLLVATPAVLARAEPWPPSIALPVVGSATTMAGWVDFCLRHEGECPRGARKPVVIRLDGRIERMIDAVNRHVNGTVAARSDADHWGVTDRWDLPTDRLGDCEDFVLQKRKLLIENGLPRQALHVTVVYYGKNEGHAVLLVRTDRGDYVLDHLAEEIRPWCDTPYRYVKRQSDGDPDVWVSLYGSSEHPLCRGR